MSEILLFNKYSSAVSVRDPALVKYINLSPVVVPRNAGRQEARAFWKSEDMHIVERLVTHLMVPGHRGKSHLYTSGRNTGKFSSNLNRVLRAFEIIEEKTKKNPVEVLVRAVENAAPMEEITTVEYGGARYPQAVDVSPQRRVDIALRVMVQGAYQKSFGKKQKMFEALAEEILSAYKLDQKSASVSKKLELERMADAAR